MIVVDPGTTTLPTTTVSTIGPRTIPRHHVTPLTPKSSSNRPDRPTPTIPPKTKRPRWTYPPRKTRRPRVRVTPARLGQTSTQSGTLGGSAIAGIVIALVAAAAFVLGTAVYMYGRSRKVS